LPFRAPFAISRNILPDKCWHVCMNEHTHMYVDNIKATS